jgi:hypothetical protein
MSTPTNAAVVAASYPLPPLVQRYAKLIWGVVGFLLVVLTTVVNNYANVMGQGWLSLIQTIIGVLTAVGVLVQQNALDPSTVVALVEKFLPNHTLVPKVDTNVLVPPAVPTLPTPSLAPAVPAAPAKPSPAPAVQAPTSTPDALPTPPESSAVA